MSGFDPWNTSDRDQLKADVDAGAMQVSWYYKKLIEEGIPERIAGDLAVAYSKGMWIAIAAKKGDS